MSYKLSIGNDVRKLTGFRRFKFPSPNLVSEPDEYEISAHLNATHERCQLRSFNFCPIHRNLGDWHLERFSNKEKFNVKSPEKRKIVKR